MTQKQFISYPVELRRRGHKMIVSAGTSLNTVMLRLTLNATAAPHLDPVSEAATSTGLPSRSAPCLICSVLQQCRLVCLSELCLCQINAVWR